MRPPFLFRLEPLADHHVLLDLVTRLAGALEVFLLLGTFVVSDPAR